MNLAGLLPLPVGYLGTFTPPPSLALLVRLLARVGEGEREAEQKLMNLNDQLANDVPEPITTLITRRGDELTLDNESARFLTFTAARFAHIGCLTVVRGAVRQANGQNHRHLNFVVNSVSLYLNDTMPTPRPVEFVVSNLYMDNDRLVDVVSRLVEIYMDLGACLAVNDAPAQRSLPPLRIT